MHYRREETEGAAHKAKRHIRDSSPCGQSCGGLTKQQQHIERKLYAASGSKQSRTRAQLINKIGFSASFADCKSASGSVTVWPSGLRCQASCVFLLRGFGISVWNDLTSGEVLRIGYAVRRLLLLMQLRQ